MNPIKVIAIVLIVGGMLGLVYGGFSYTKDTTVVKLGPLEVSAKERQTVNVPLWVGVGAIVVGGLLLVLGTRGSGSAWTARSVRQSGTRDAGVRSRRWRVQAPERS